MIPNIARRKVKVAAVRLYRPISTWLNYRDSDMFIEVVIELHTYCNRKCDYCPNSMYTRPYAKMPTKVFKDIIRQLVELDYRHLISFIGFCEPTLDKRLQEFAGYIREKLPKCRMRMFTNGDFLTPELRKSLDNSGVKIILSSHETNLKRNNLMNQGGLVKVRKNCLKGIKKCIYPAFRFMITASGNVIPCCGDYFESVKLGNVKKEPMLSIWRRTKSFRHGIASGELIPKIELCRKCTEHGG